MLKIMLVLGAIWIAAAAVGAQASSRHSPVCTVHYEMVSSEYEIAPAPEGYVIWEIRPAPGYGFNVAICTK